MFFSSFANFHLTFSLSSMPDLSDVGAPAKGPGLPQRLPEAPPPPVKVKIQHGRNVESAEQLKLEILTKVPGAIVDTALGEDVDLTCSPRYGTGTENPIKPYRQYHWN